MRGRQYSLALLFLLSNCTGNKGSSNDFDKALQTYTTEATQRATTLSESLATAYVTELQSGNQDPDTTVVDQHEAEIADLGEFLCQRLRSLAADAGSGKDKADHMAAADALSEQIVRDQMVAALINGALSQPAERRDQFLTSIGVKAIGPDGSELRGTAALADAGILDSNGTVKVPERGTAEYTKYLDWLGHEARGLAAPELVEPAIRKAETCAAA